MTRLALLRHGATAWNAEGRLQGRSDQPLSPAGRAKLQGRRLPPEFAAWRVLVSPLLRARETASILGLGKSVVDKRLVEMDWGAYEGRTLAEIRAQLGTTLSEEEDRGLDFQAPGGESPRAVQARLLPLLAELAASGSDALAITHKGVIRAILALADDWDMLGKPPRHLDWDCVHVFRLQADGIPRLERPNVALPAAVAA
jgi:broad specificity phosphatase PhoE